MNTVKLDEYYSAGYFLIRKNKRPDWLDEPVGLVPAEMVSLEREFCPKFHLAWGWGSTDRTRALNFGIDETKWADFEKWCANHDDHEIEIWSMFRSTSAARRFIETFIPEPKWDDLFIVGVGLHQSHFVDWEEPYGTEGVEIRISERLPLEGGGQAIGFDVASYAHNDFDHTWFSHGHHKGIFENLGIRPGKYGLLQTPEEAVLAQAYTNEHDGYSYEYWLLVAYPLRVDDPILTDSKR